MRSIGITGAILAGGCSSRMLGQDKALSDLAGKPLLQHVVDRVAEQVDELAICIESEAASIYALGLVQLADPLPGHRGPLGGVLSALRYTSGRNEWLLVVPCDAPFLPLDLAAELRNRAEQADSPCAVVRWRGHRQPTFSLWHTSLLKDVEQAFETRDQAGLWACQDRCHAVALDWPDHADTALPEPFFNVNDVGALERAREWLVGEVA